MSLQGPLLRAKYGWVKSDIILISAYDHLGEPLSFTFDSEWSFSDGVSLRTAVEKYFPHIKTIHFAWTYPLPFCITFFTTDLVGLGFLLSIGCKSIFFCLGGLFSCILSNVCTFCGISIRYAKASVANSWPWWKGHGCLRFYYHVDKFSAVFCYSCKLLYYFSYYLSKEYYLMILLPLGQFLKFWGQGLGPGEATPRLSHGRWPRGATPHPRSGRCRGKGGPRGAIPRWRSGRAAVRRYPSSKVRSSGCALLEQSWRDTPRPR